MRVTPRTAVPCVVPVLRPRWVSFVWSHALALLDDERRAELDADWEEIGLSGAVVLHPVAALPGSGVRTPRICTDELATTNVLCRNRSGLLHAGFGLTDLYATSDVGWCTDDPRLVRLVDERNQR